MICHFSSEFNDFHDAVIHVVQEIQCSEITNLHRICGCGYDRNMTWYIKCHVQYFSIIVMFSTNRSTSWFEQAGALSTIHIAVLFGTSPGFQKTKITSRGLLLSVIYIFVSTDLPHNELFFFNTKIVGENPFMVSHWEKLRFHTLQVHLPMRKRMLTLHLPRSHLATSEWPASTGGRWRDLVDGIVGAKVAKVEIVISLIWCGGFSLLKFLVFIAGQLRRRRSAVWGWYS